MVGHNCDRGQGGHVNVGVRDASFFDNICSFSFYLSYFFRITKFLLSINPWFCVNC